MPHNLSRQGHGQHYMMQPSSFSKNFFSTAEVYDDENDWEEDTASLAFVSEDAQGKNTSKRAKIRLYRMLLRQCETLVDPSKDDTEHIMLQPMVVSTPSRYVKTGPPVVTKPMDIYKLFYALMEHENKLLGTNNEKQNDYTYESPTYGKNPQERQKIDASIDDWFFEVSGGIIPSFPNDDNDDNYRSLLTKSCWTTKKQLQKVLKYAFKTHYTRVDSYTLLQLAIRATKILREQQSMWEKSTVATTDGVRVIATSRYVFIGSHSFFWFGSKHALTNFPLYSWITVHSDHSAMLGKPRSAMSRPKQFMIFIDFRIGFESKTCHPITFSFWDDMRRFKNWKIVARKRNTL